MRGYSSVDQDTHDDFKPKYKGAKNDVNSQIEKDIKGHDVFLYMKGTPLQPQCGFSNRVVQILNAYGELAGLLALAVTLLAQQLAGAQARTRLRVVGRHARRRFPVRKAAGVAVQQRQHSQCVSDGVARIQVCGTGHGTSLRTQRYAKVSRCSVTGPPSHRYVSTP